MKAFRVKNDNGDIEVCIFKKANVVFQTNEYNETEDACIYRETINIFELVSNYKQLQQENKQLKDNINQIDDSVDKLQKQLIKKKDNWNMLKEHIQKDYDFFGKLIDPKYGCAMGALSRVKDKIQELGQGSDSNE